MIIWNSFKLQNTNVTINFTATTSGSPARPLLKINAPVEIPVLTIDTLKGLEGDIRDIKLSNDLILHNRSLKSPNADAGLWIGDGASLWGTLKINESHSNTYTSFYGPVNFYQPTTFSAAITSNSTATFNGSASFANVTITDLKLLHSVTLPAGSKIEGMTVTDLFNCNLILYGKKVENNYQVWPANVSSLPVKVIIPNDSGGTTTMQLDPYSVSETKVLIGGDRNNIQIQYSFGSYADEISPTFTLPQSTDDTRIGICHSLYAKEVLPWLRQIISNDSTTGEVWLLYSIFDDYQTGQRQLSAFQVGNNYKIGLGNCFPSLSQQITTWGTDIYDGKVYGPGWEARLPAGGIIGFKPKS